MASRASPCTWPGASATSRCRSTARAGKVLLDRQAEGVREEVDLKAPGKRVVSGEEPPGESVLDEVLEDLQALEEASGEEPSEGSDDKEAE